MRTDLGAFFQNYDFEIGIKLFQPDCGAKTRRPRAHDHNVVFHRFACHIDHVITLFLNAVRPARLARP